MGRRTAKKVEAWLTDDEWSIVERHMHNSHAGSEANYVRIAVLRGLPAQDTRLDGLVNDLVLAVNRLTQSVAERDSAEVAAWLQYAKKLVRDLQKSQAIQRLHGAGRV